MDSIHHPSDQEPKTQDPTSPVTQDHVERTGFSSEFLGAEQVHPLP